MAVIHNKKYGGDGMAAHFKRFGLTSLFSALVSITYSTVAFAGTTQVDDVILNMSTSSQDLPGLIAALSYLLGLLLGILGVLKIREHVENPNQTPLRGGVVRLLIGGTLFALPIVYEAVSTTIGSDAGLTFDNNAIANDISGIFGSISGLVPTLNFNNILANIRDSVEDIPGLIAIIAYLMGLVIAVAGLLKIRDHVDNPEQTTIKEPVIRLLIAGALFSLPTIYNAMFDVVGGNGLGIIGSVSSILGGLGFLYSGYAQTVCNPVAGTVGAIGGALGLGGGPSMGQSLCGILLHAGAFPAFLTACGYVIGLVLGLWGIFKIRDHVINPQQTGIWEGVSRLIAGGFFFALPIVVEVARNTLSPTALAAPSLVPVTGYNTGGAGGIGGFIAGLLGGGGCGGAGGLAGFFGLGGGGGTGGLGLDALLVCMMGDMMGPLHVVLNFFAFCAGMILLMIGVSRLIKSAQDGARGPGGIGTVMTFVAGAALISYNDMIRAFSTTLVGSPVSFTFATMQYTTGMTGAEVAAAHATISAILQFVIVVGLISFVRGIFIIRSVAEGNQQASIMAGVTHIVGGALAVNLGPVLNMVQNTLGIGGFGIAFT